MQDLLKLLQDNKDNILFIDDGVKSVYEIDEIELIDNKVIIRGGANKNGIQQPHEYPRDNDRFPQRYNKRM